MVSEIWTFRLNFGCLLTTFHVQHYQRANGLTSHVTKQPYYIQTLGSPGFRCVQFWASGIHMITVQNVRLKVICGGHKIPNQGVQWGSEYQKHLNTELFEVRISNGLVFKWSGYGLCPMHQTTFENQTIWHLTSFQTFKYRAQCMSQFVHKHKHKRSQFHKLSH